MMQKQTVSRAIAFHFCDYNSTTSLEPVNILASLTVQLGKQSDAAFKMLECFYEELHPEIDLTRQPEAKGMIEVTRAMINESILSCRRSLHILFWRNLLGRSPGRRVVNSGQR